MDAALNHVAFDSSAHAGSDVFGDTLMGDFYHETNNVVRGCCLAAPTEFDAFFLAPYDAATGKLQPRTLEDVDFSATEHPGVVPLGGHASTSMVLEGMTAAQAMQAIYSIFDKELTATIVKLRLKKCWLSAEVFVQDGQSVFSQCLVKARVFDYKQGQLLIEFRRRSGDALAFASAFEKAKACLQLTCDQGAESALPLIGAQRSAVPVQVSEPIQVDELMPLIAMVASGKSPEIQSEGLTSLAVLANAATCMSAAAVCVAVKQLQNVLAGLVLSPMLSLSYPAARLSSLLMMCGGDSSVTLTMKVAEAVNSTEGLVREELEKALAAASMVGSPQMFGAAGTMQQVAV